MARRPRKAMVVELDDEPADPATTPTKTVEEEEADQVIEEDRAENPRPAYKEVERLDPETGQPAFVGRFAVDVVTKDFLARRFGGGAYRVTTRKPKAMGGMKFAERRTILIDPAVRPERAIDGEPAPRGDNGKGDFIEKMLLLQMDSSAKMMAAITGAFAALAGAGRSAPTTDPLLLELVKGMMARPVADPMEFATKMFTMLQDRGHVDPLDQLKKLLEIKELVGGGGETGSGELGLIGKGLDLVGQMIVKGQPEQPAAIAARAETAPVTESLPAEPPHTAVWERPTAPMGHPAVAAPTGTVELRLWKQAVVPQLPRAIEMAQWMPPEAAALTLWAQANEAQRADIRADLAGGAVPASPLQEADADRFVEQAMDDFAVDTIPGMTPRVTDWIAATLYGLCDLATEPEEPESAEEAPPVAGTITPQPPKGE